MIGKNNSIFFNNKNNITSDIESDDTEKNDHIKNKEKLFIMDDNTSGDLEEIDIIINKMKNNKIKHNTIKKENNFESNNSNTIKIIDDYDHSDNTIDLNLIHKKEEDEKKSGDHYAFSNFVNSKKKLSIGPKKNFDEKILI